jgi:putative ABC transport system permease protein
MQVRDLIRRSGRSLRNAKGRTLLTAFAIAVGTFALTLTLAASNGATSFVNKIISENFDPAELLVSKDEAIFGGGNTATKPREYDANFTTITNNAGANTQIKLLDDSDIAVIKKTDGVERVRENIIVSLRYITRPGQPKYIGNVTAKNPFQKPETLAGDATGTLENQQLLLPEGYLDALGFKSAQDAVGQKVTLAIGKALTPAVLAQSAQGLVNQSPAELQKLSEQNIVLEEFTVAAVLKKPATSQPGTDLYLLVNQDEARRLNDITTTGTTNFRKYSYVNVRIANGDNVTKLTAGQDALKKAGFQTQSVKDTQKFLTNIIGVLQGIVFGFGLIAIIASVFGIVNTMYISVLQRTREIGLMKALGMRKRDIGRLFRFEAAWIGFLGGLLGSLIAVALGTALNPWISTKLNLGAGNSILIFKPVQIAILVLLLMGISILAGWLPSRKAAKLDPIEALRTE